MAGEAGENLIKYRLLISIGLSFFLAAQTAWPVSVSDGRELYEKHCVRCHGPDGRGVHSLIPDFQRLEGLLVSDRRLKRHIRYGKGGCPSFAGVIKEDKIFDLVTYLRVLR